MNNEVTFSDGKKRMLIVKALQYTNFSPAGRGSETQLKPKMTFTTYMCRCVQVESKHI